MKILLAVDNSVCSEVAVLEVAQRTWPPGSEIKVLAVQEPLKIPRHEQWVFTDNYYVQMESTALDRARASAKLAAGQLRQQQGTAVTVTSEVVASGHPTEVILSTATAWHADLIVLGSHGQHGWKRLWLGSVSRAVATQAPCSVEIVRCPHLDSDQPAAR